MTRFSALVLTLMLFFSAPVGAQEQNAQQNQAFVPKDFPFGYSPEYCDFFAAFPEDPLVLSQCEDENDATTCFDLISYTKVFGLSSTVKAQLICNPATTEMYDHFTTEVMEGTVRTMTKDKVVKEINVESREEKEYRQSGMVAQGRQGLNDTLYIAQLWVAQNSIMSVELELMGEQTAAADQLFANLLRNIGHIKEIKGEEFGTKKIQAYLEKKKMNEEQKASPDEVTPAAP